MLTFNNSMASVFTVRAIYFYAMYVCPSVCMCMIMEVGAYGRQRVPDPLEVELHVVVNHLIWVLGTEPKSSASAASALDMSHLCSSSLLILSTTPQSVFQCSSHSLCFSSFSSNVDYFLVLFSLRSCSLGNLL